MAAVEEHKSFSRGGLHFRVFFRSQEDAMEVERLYSCVPLSGR